MGNVILFPASNSKACVRIDSTSYEILHRGIFNPESNPIFGKQLYTDVSTTRRATLMTLTPPYYAGPWRVDIFDQTGLSTLGFKFGTSNDAFTITHTWPCIYRRKYYHIWIYSSRQTQR